MSAWDEPDERARPAGFGGDWRGTRASFDDPMSWSFPVFRVWGITVRVHLFFLVFVLASLSKSASVLGGNSLSMVLASLGLAAHFAVILLHEFGHCIACRWRGGTADEILIWPLGGLATCNPPERAEAHFWTAVGGPLVNVLFIAVLTPWIGLTYGQWLGCAIPNPFDLTGMLQRVGVADNDWLGLLLLVTNYIAWALLLFNLLPMFPLDGGRILQAILWKRVGYARSMRLACRTGLFGAVLLGIVALSIESTTLLAIALFGGVVCFTTSKQVDRERDYLGFDPDPAELAAVEDELDDDVREVPRRAGRRSVATPDVRGTAASKPSDIDGAREAEIDRILAKIARDGIGSLSPTERETLQRATDEKRDGDRRGG